MYYLCFFLCLCFTLTGAGGSLSTSRSFGSCEKPDLNRGFVDGAGDGSGVMLVGVAVAGEAWPVGVLSFMIGTFFFWGRSFC